MKTLLTTPALITLLLLTACGGSSGKSVEDGPCGPEIREMRDTAGNPDGPPEILTYQGNTGIFYTYTRFDFEVGLFHGKDFNGCEFEIRPL